jgi:AcrR family transcriptional regulator
MARPKVPLISRRRALEVALQIIDSEGLQALSMRRLGEALKVNGASLYHHFENKEDILLGVTRLALAGPAVPEPESENWRIWLPRVALRLRRALVAHPELIPIMLRRGPAGMAADERESRVARLQSAGVPMALVLPLMESLELLAITSALQQISAAAEDSRNGPDAASQLPLARKARGLSSEDVFDVASSVMVAAVESAFRQKQTRPGPLP